MEIDYDFDLFVIGGGSGGLAASKEASKYEGLKIGLADFVVPTPKGTKWGLGGTCVNVGCIPKKLMHYSAILGESMKDQRECGWALSEQVEHSWEKMLENVTMHIRKLNWGYKSQLSKKKIKYFNAYASFIDSHTIKLKTAKGDESQITARFIIIAVGLRPNLGGIEGAIEHGITSDDLFWLKQPPKKTLIIGASYIALECAGFLNAIGFDVTVMVRSILLRGFDTQMAIKTGAHMEKMGVKFIKECVPLKIEANAERKQVHYKQTKGDETGIFECDTVLFAIGRIARTLELELPNAGVQVKENGKLRVNEKDQTNVQNIYAIGDVVFGILELTPVAIKSGKLLAHRLFGGSTKLMDYSNICTTVFTPLEYACCGMSEEKAIAQFGEDGIEVLHTHFKPLEWNMFGEHEDNECYTKAIVQKETQKVVGVHLLSPNAAEVMQGIGLAMKCGLTKENLEDTVGIHPTVAEEIVLLSITKKEDPVAQKTGC